jgi:protein O-GlcNAc transferase
VPTVAEVFAQAWQKHQTGNFSHAEQLYRQILQADPGHADAWCFLGAACQSQGKIAEAEANFRKAVQLLPTHPSAQNCLGILLAEQGKFDEAAASFQKLIAMRPGEADTHNNLGIVRARQGRWREAVECYERALLLRPDFPAARTNLNQALQQIGAPPRPSVATVVQRPDVPDALSAANQRGVTFAQQGRLEEARIAFEEALRLRPDDADTQNNLGIVFDLLGRRQEAINYYHRALQRKPDLVAAHYNLGVALMQSRRLPEAMASFERAIQLKPDHADAYNNLAIVLMEQNRLEEAAICCQKALKADPKHAGVLTNLGNVHQRRNQLDLAVQCYLEALRINPKFAEAYNNLAKTYQDQRKLSAAIKNYETALELKPDFAEAHYNLGNALRDAGQLEEAIKKYRHTLTLKQDFPFAHNNLGDALLKQGRPEMAIASFKEALRLQPDLGTAQSNYLFCFNYDPNADPVYVFGEHCRWGKTFESVRSTVPHSNDQEPERRLKIGYISPDFRFHPLARYFEPVLATHDPQKVETFCYAEVLYPDHVTERLQKLSNVWRSTCHKTDAEVADLIRADQIDILVDLAGHTANNRLAVLARKPAPIQATWLGYMNTTGLAAVDYRITDAILDPSGQPVRDTEELVRLPDGMCCFQPPADAPDVNALPALAKGHLTFGCLHNLFKLNSQVFDLWARVLRAIPTAHLLIFRETMTPTGQEYLRGQFAQRGVAAERLDMRKGSSGPGYLKIFDEIDVCLDAFPCTGGVTTCESLWMGAPVVTLCGQRPAARNSAALLARMDLNDWVAQTPDEYVAIAQNKAKGLDQLADLRGKLRERMRIRLCDAKRFTPLLEEAYRTMWSRWCNKRRGSAVG